MFAPRQTDIANGVVTSSPGLGGTTYPGVNINNLISTLTRSAASWREHLRFRQPALHPSPIRHPVFATADVQTAKIPFVLPAFLAVKKFGSRLRLVRVN
jgi:hypothetical protein